MYPIVVAGWVHAPSGLKSAGPGPASQPSQLQASSSSPGRQDRPGPSWPANLAHQARAQLAWPIVPGLARGSANLQWPRQMDWSSWHGLQAHARQAGWHPFAPPDAPHPTPRPPPYPPRLPAAAPHTPPPHHTLLLRPAAAPMNLQGHGSKMLFASIGKPSMHTRGCEHDHVDVRIGGGMPMLPPAVPMPSARSVGGVTAS